MQMQSHKSSRDSVQAVYWPVGVACIPGILLYASDRHTDESSVERLLDVCACDLSPACWWHANSLSTTQSVNCPHAQ